MKRFIQLAIVAFLVSNITSCKEDENPIFDPPAFTLTAASSSVKVDLTTTITVNISSAMGTVASISGSVTGGGSIGAFTTDPIGGTSGTATATYTAGSSAGNDVITVIVTDSQNPAKETTETLAITITELDPPTVMLSASTASGDPGTEQSVTVTIGAEAGLDSWSVSLDGEEIYTEDATGTSGGGTYTYEIAARDQGDLEFTISVEDSNGTTNSSTWTVTVNAVTPAVRWALAFVQDLNFSGNPEFAAQSIVPSLTGDAGTGTALAYDDDFLEDVDYLGAVDPAAGTPWYALDTWSFYAHILSGINDKTRTQGGNTITVTSTDLNGNGTDDVVEALQSFTWTKDNTYLLDGFVFVGDDEFSEYTLTIEAGTVIKGKPTVGEEASALIISRGSKIFANGTSAEPVIFTHEADPLDGTTQPTVRGMWGGLIILGRAGLNSANGSTQIEGIPTNEPRGLYGGNLNDDSSGELHYVSIRHGGYELGAGSGNEINGLTLGGVGSATVIDHIEIVANKDDGVEWFGGTVNAKNLIVAYQGDDGIDYDEGFRGKTQFVIVHQDPAAGDRGGEHDGGTDPETGSPYATPTFANVTSVGANPGKRAVTLRDNAGGFYWNSIFTGWGSGVDIEDIPADAQDSYKQFLDGNLGFRNNLFHNITAGSTASDLFKVVNP